MAKNIENADEGLQQSYLLDVAKCNQQTYYELLPGWTVYTEDEHKYLKHNIGFSIFGLNMGIDNSEKETNCMQIVQRAVERVDTNASIMDEAFKPKPEAEEVIEAIFNQIQEYGKGYGCDPESICCEIIYTVYVLNESLEKSVAQPSNPENKEVMIRSATVQSEEREEHLDVRGTPVFKIRKEKDEFQNETWYIDTRARVYKSWTAYKENNTLPECKMILPKDGSYQPDPDYVESEEFSVVWLEILDSPACQSIKKVVNAIDMISLATGTAGLVVGIAGMFTPLAPVIATGAAVNAGVNGLWVAGRSAQKLYDRAEHKKSINVTDREAAPAWLGIAGSVSGMVASGSTNLLARTAQNGENISRATQYAVNAAQFGNLGINIIGVGHQGYCIYKKYDTNGEIDAFDVFLFGTHVLFLGNAVMNFETAGDIIRSSQGKVIDGYRSGLKNKNLKRKFNRVKRRAAQNNNQDTFAENAEVIRYINKRDVAKFKAAQMQTNITGDSQDPSIISFINGKSNAQGISLEDPMVFVTQLIQNRGTFSSNGMRFEATPGHEDADRSVLSKLRDVIKKFLDAWNNLKHKYQPRVESTISNFETILQELRYMDPKKAERILRTMFIIAKRFIDLSDKPLLLLHDVVKFFWDYAKRSLETYCCKLLCSFADTKAHKSICIIVTEIMRIIDMKFEKFSKAFEAYARAGIAY